MDQSIIREFKGTHPKIMHDWLPNEAGIFQAAKNYIPTQKQKKHQIMKRFENFFGIDLSKKHFKLI